MSYTETGGDKLNYLIMNYNDIDDDLIEKYFPMLTQAKQQKIVSMKSVEDRKIAFCGEILARQCLSQELNAPEFSFQLLLNINSKCVVGNFDAEISLVRCGEILGCAVSHNYIGIGINYIQPFSFRDAQNLLTDSEIRAVFSDSVYSFAEIVNMNEIKEENVMKKFALLSSLKEAYFQASGRGIRSEIKNFSFEFTSSGLICTDKEFNILKSYISADKKVISVVERIKK